MANLEIETNKNNRQVRQAETGRKGFFLDVIDLSDHEDGPRESPHSPGTWSQLEGTRAGGRTGKSPRMSNSWNQSGARPKNSSGQPPYQRPPPRHPYPPVGNSPPPPPPPGMSSANSEPLRPRPGRVSAVEEAFFPTQPQQQQRQHQRTSTTCSSAMAPPGRPAPKPIPRGPQTNFLNRIQPCLPPSDILVTKEAKNWSLQKVPSFLFTYDICNNV